LLIAHGVALWALLQAGIYVMLAVVAASFFYYLRLWRGHDSLRMLHVQGENCRFEYGQGTALQGCLAKRHFVSDFLLIVQVQQPQRRCCRYLVLFRDSLEQDAFRRLRVLLLFPESTVPNNSLVSK